METWGISRGVRITSSRVLGISPHPWERLPNLDSTVRLQASVLLAKHGHWIGRHCRASVNRREVAGCLGDWEIRGVIWYRKIQMADFTESLSFYEQSPPSLLTPLPTLFVLIKHHV